MRYGSRLELDKYDTVLLYSQGKHSATGPYLGYHLALRRESEDL